MTNLHERVLPDPRIEIATVRMPGGHASDQATPPDILFTAIQTGDISLAFCQKFPQGSFIVYVNSQDWRDCAVAVAQSNLSEPFLVKLIIVLWALDFR